jgi:hypothetical protein
MAAGNVENLFIFLRVDSAISMFLLDLRRDSGFQARQNFKKSRVTAAGLICSRRFQGLLVPIPTKPLRAVHG